MGRTASFLNKETQILFYNYLGSEAVIYATFRILYDAGILHKNRGIDFIQNKRRQNLIISVFTP